MPKKHRKTTWATIALLTLSVVVALLLAEFVVRLIIPQQLIVLRPDIWTPDDGLGWHHAPNIATKINTGEREIDLRTDELGHRVGRKLVATPHWRVLAIGDSFLEALQVDYEDTFSHLLETRIARMNALPGRVVNAGVGGWDPNQYLIATKRELSRSKYDAVLVFLFVGNDIVSKRVDNIPPRQPAKRHSLRLPKSLEKSELVDALAFPVNDFLEQRSQLFVLMKSRLKFLLMRIGLSRHYFPRTLLRSNEAAKDWETTAAICASIAKEASNVGAKSAFVILPAITQINLEQTRRYMRALSLADEEIDLAQPTRLLPPLLELAGLRVVDLTPRFQREYARGADGLYGTVDTHLSPAGHSLVAEQVMSDLRDILAVDGASLD